MQEVAPATAAQTWDLGTSDQPRAGEGAVQQVFGALVHARAHPRDDSQDVCRRMKNEGETLEAA
ncbi:MAG: hypothetical protein G01um101477_223 [Candidatus Doudnabacteria bacterium Gr01-1014_77]|uniref:Uncharacterized protein n=1 Tax=Candidatus Doudnabacteria bacterium Gr01-1014_77 TaxID=2017133 RepID=A0A554JCK1_9BACT|nr:MAG: hypothetical protein G01um101477_223 [Candidatus Doudnabacteria bacterium Gr01-1014_77]